MEWKEKMEEQGLERRNFFPTEFNTIKGCLRKLTGNSSKENTQIIGTVSSTGKQHCIFFSLMPKAMSQ